jgi:hypothetical protein
VADGVADRLVEGQQDVGHDRPVDALEAARDRSPEIGEATGVRREGQVHAVRHRLVTARPGPEPPTPVGDGLKPAERGSRQDRGDDAARARRIWGRTSPGRTREEETAPEPGRPSSQVPPAMMLDPLRDKGFSRLTPCRAAC